MTINKFNLGPVQATSALQDQLFLLKGLDHPAVLDGVDTDTAFLLGYETAIDHFKRATGPDPMEVYVAVEDPTDLRKKPVLRPVTPSAVIETITRNTL